MNESTQEKRYTRCKCSKFLRTIFFLILAKLVSGEMYKGSNFKGSAADGHFILFDKNDRGAPKLLIKVQVCWYQYLELFVDTYGKDKCGKIST